MASVFRAHPLILNGKTVAEASTTNEDRNANVSNQFGLFGVEGQAVGADETAIDFDLIVPVQGTEIDMDSLLGVPITLGVIRNGKLALVDGTLASSNYTSESQSGKSMGKFKFVGGAPRFL